MAAAKPGRAGPADGQSPYGVRKGDGEADVPEVEHRWVDCHEVVVLKKWVRPRPVDGSVDRGERPWARRQASRGRRVDADLEWIGDGQHQPEEEQCHPAQHCERRSAEPVRLPPVLTANEIGKPGEDETPQEDRAFQRSPRRGYVEREGC